MRTDDQTSLHTAELSKQVKQALANLNDPITLYRHPLTHLLPPTYLTSAGGDPGRAFQTALYEAIERIKPAGSPSDTSREWRPYNILRYHYIERMGVQEVIHRLGVSEREFRRSQQKAMEGVADFLRELAYSQYLFATPYPIPRSTSFVGREKELAVYRRRLEEEHLAVIVGPAGVGKTSLGAELAAKREAQSYQIIWVTFRDGRNTNLEAFMETIALSLAALGQSAYWHFLQAEWRKESPLSSESRARYLLATLEKAKYMLCLDDFQLVHEDKAINSLCADLAQVASQRKLWLLVMSRIAPRFARERPSTPLGGLCREDARHLLETIGLPALPEALFEKLYTHTTGLPIFLNLFAAWVCSHGLETMESEAIKQQVASFVENMAKDENVKDYLFHELYDSLSLPERRLLTYASVFRTTFDTEEEPIITQLTAEGVPDIEGNLAALTNRHILNSLKGGIVALHPLLREYLRHRLRMSPDDHTRIHHLVGEYYEQNRRNAWDMTEAGYHYFEAMEYERASRLLSENVVSLINTGQAEAALKQLEQLAPHLAGAALRFEAAAARESLCNLLGARQKQKEILDAMLTMAEEPGSEQQLAVVHNRRAWFHAMVGEYAAALAAAEAGLAAAQQTQDKTMAAESLYHWGLTLKLRGDHVTARERCEQALALIEETDNPVRKARILNTLGNICYRLGDHAAAQSFYMQSLAIRQEMGDQQGEANVLNNLGNICYRSGDIVAARCFREEALTISRAIGDQQCEAATLVNLSEVCHIEGDCAAARLCCEQALVIAQAIGERQYEASGLNTLSVICYTEGDYAAARACCEQALSIQQAIGDRHGIGNTLTGLGMTLERMGDLDGAEAAYHEAMIVRREIGQDILAIEDVAGLGRVALAKATCPSRSDTESSLPGQTGQSAQADKVKNEREKAMQYAKECLAHLAAHGIIGIAYPFELYLTCARVLEACDEREQARLVLEQAYTLLTQRANKINNESLRQSFLEKVPIHRQVVQAWQKISR